MGKNSLKGQITFTNFIQLVIVLLLYAILAYPLLTPIINTRVAELQAGNQTDITPIQIALLQLTQPLLLLAIFITMFHYAKPEPVRGL